MELPQAIVYADIGEVRMETRAAECNRLLKEGWILLGVYPLTTLGDMTGERGAHAPASELACGMKGLWCRNLRIVRMDVVLYTPLIL
jgi:hypothetical protein